MLLHSVPRNCSEGVLGDLYPRVVGAIGNLRRVIIDDLQVEDASAPRGRQGRTRAAEHWRRRFYHARAKRNEAEERQQAAERRAPGRITAYWLTQAGLSDPGASLRSVQEWCA